MDVIRRYPVQEALTEGKEGEGKEGKGEGFGCYSMSNQSLQKALKGATYLLYDPTPDPSKHFLSYVSERTEVVKKNR